MPSGKLEYVKSKVGLPVDAPKPFSPGTLPAAERARSTVDRAGLAAFHDPCALVVAGAVRIFDAGDESQGHLELLFGHAGGK